MPSTILLRSPSAVDDKRIVLNNSQFGRQFNIPGWTRIRIGMRMAFRDYGANIPGLPFFAFGICSGTTNMVGDATTSNFIGMAIGGSTFTRGATGPLYTTGAIPYAYRKGATITTFGTLASSSMGFGADALNGLMRGAYMIDITKGSPNWSFVGLYRNATAAVSDVSRDQFMDYMEVGTMVSGGLTNHTVGSASTLADATINESGDGSFDTINICWGRTHALPEISDIAIMRFT